MRLLSNDLLLRRVPTQAIINGIHMPPSMLDDYNNGMTHMFKLVAKGPGRLTKRGTVIPFEANPGDNLIIFPITTGPQDVGNGQFILKKPEESVLAVVPVQNPTSAA